MTVSNTLERFNYFNNSTTILKLNNNALHQNFVNLYNLNVGTFTLADHESKANALLSDLCQFPVDYKRGRKNKENNKSFTTKTTRADRP